MVNGIEWSMRKLLNRSEPSSGHCYHTHTGRLRLEPDQGIYGNYRRQTNIHIHAAWLETLLSADLRVQVCFARCGCWADCETVQVALERRCSPVF